MLRRVVEKSVSVRGREISVLECGHALEHKSRRSPAEHRRCPICVRSNPRAQARALVEQVKLEGLSK